MDATIENKERFHRIMMAMGAVFGTQVTEAMLDAYWMALEDLELDELARAAKAMISGSEFFPRPVQIRRAAGEKSPEDRAADAWVCFEQAWRRYSSAELDFEDSLINATVRAIGGPAALGDKTVDEWPWVQKAFEKTYARYCQYPPPEDLRSALPSKSRYSITERVTIPAIGGRKQLRLTAGHNNNEGK